MNSERSSLEEQVTFLKQKIEALSLENTYLREQNSKLAEEMDVRLHFL